MRFDRASSVCLCEKAWVSGAPEALRIGRIRMHDRQSGVEIESPLVSVTDVKNGKGIQVETRQLLILSMLVYMEAKHRLGEAP